MKNENTIKLLTVAQAAEMLGITRSSLYGLMHQRKIDYYRSKGGKKCYFSLDDLTDWMTSSHITSK